MSHLSNKEVNRILRDFGFHSSHGYWIGNKGQWGLCYTSTPSHVKFSITTEYQRDKSISFPHGFSLNRKNTSNTQSSDVLVKKLNNFFIK